MIILTGKGHLISNTCSLALLAVGFDAAVNHCDNTYVSDFIQNVSNWCIPHASIAHTALGLLLFYFGTLLPDCDSKNSMLGKIMHIPVEHRTITHAVWIPIGLFVLSIMYRPLLCLVLGYMLHLLWDNLSKCGVCYFWPVSKYKYFGNSGAKIKKKHIFYLYRTCSSSEYVLLSILVMITIILICFYTYQNGLSYLSRYIQL